MYLSRYGYYYLLEQLWSPTRKSSPLLCNAYIVVPGTAFLATNQVTFSEIQLQQFKQQKPHLSSFAGDFLSTMNTSSALVLYRRCEFTSIVWSFLFLLPLVFPLRHCTEVRLTEGAVFVSGVCKVSFTPGSLVPKYCLMLTFLSLRSKYYGDDVKVVATMAGKEMVYGKKNHSDSGETSPLNDIFRERHSPTTSKSVEAHPPQKFCSTHRRHTAKYHCVCGAEVMTKRELQEHSPKSCIFAAETGDNQPILKFWACPHSLENCHPVNINSRWTAACYDGNIPPREFVNETTSRFPF